MENSSLWEFTRTGDVMPFPPTPSYPLAVDSDYTLYLVHNGVESQICPDNQAWSEEIEIVPVGDDQQEIWPSNGFANLDGELLYYDSVGLDSNGKVNKLKGCARNLGGDPTKYNVKGTYIRSFVVAEHHNQLVTAIIKTQDFIGYNFDTRQKTLDWRIRNLQALDVVFDDYTCPDVDFAFNIIENDPVKGITASYRVEMNTLASTTNYRLDFGDGNFTTTEFSGQHVYALNARIDPVVSISNDKCQMIITPVERNNSAEPSYETRPIFEIPIPEVPEIPDFTFVPSEVPSPDIVLPPLVVPCFSVEGLGQTIDIPSLIDGIFGRISNIVINGPDNPIQILHSRVEITGPGGGPISIPSFILIEPPVPPTIIIDPPIPPTIVIIPPASSIVLALDASDIPKLEVDWGTPPDMAVALTFAREVKSPELFSVDPALVQEFGEEFSDLFEASQTMKVSYENVGIPTEIKVVSPNIDPVKFDVSNLPEQIKIDASEVKIPDIKIHGPEHPIPDTIKLEGDRLPDRIDLIYSGSPIPVEVNTEVVVKLESTTVIPDKIIIEVPKPIPERIIVESNIPDKIILEGPPSIPLELPKDIGIPVIFPDQMPEIVHRIAPIELKISLDEVLSQSGDGQKCVMITPCPRT